MNDQKLLRRFLKDGDDPAFTTLVERYLGMVYGVTYRRTGNRELAEELAQNVFATLARKAPKIKPDVILPGWLHRAAVYECTHAIRSEYSHQRKMNAFSQHTGKDGFSEPEIWNDVWPVLDEAIEELSPSERDLVFMRFVQEQTFGQIGNHVGKSESATQRHLQRVLEKLGLILKKRGITASTAILTLCLTPELAKAAPAGLVTSTVSQGALATASSATATSGITTSLSITKTTLIVAAVSLTALAVQQWKVHQTSEKTDALRKRVNATQAALESDERDQREDQTDSKKILLDWKLIAEEALKIEQGGVPSTRFMTEIHPVLENFNKEQLLAEFDHVAATELSEILRSVAEGVLIQRLAKKGPGLVLERFIDQLNGPNRARTSQLINVFRLWAAQDLETATAWLDHEVTQGTFANKSLSRKNRSYLWFEAAVFENLLIKDPASARARILKFPEPQQRGIFQQASSLEPGTEVAYIEILREIYANDEKGKIFSKGAYITLTKKKGSPGVLERTVDQRSEAYEMPTYFFLERGGYPNVAKFMENIEATPEERVIITFHAVLNRFQLLAQTQRTLTRQHFNEAREFVTKHAPKETDMILGQAFASMASGGSLASILEPMKIIENIYTEGTSDELIRSILSSFKATRMHSSQIPFVKALIGKLPDEAEQQKWLEHFQ